MTHVQKRSSNKAMVVGNDNAMGSDKVAGSCKANKVKSLALTQLQSSTDRYIIGDKLGHGAYGIVREAVDSSIATGDASIASIASVAIKTITLTRNDQDTIRIVREIKLLNHLKHPNIIKMTDMILVPERWNVVSLVFEKMDMDMHCMIKENDDLSWMHHMAFMLQLLRGVEYMHDHDIIHRDLKPKNILINENCQLKIADFGLSRPLSTADFESPWSDYIASRWYRPPELCGSFFKRYSKPIDMWAIGCIFGEMILRAPVFPGNDTVDQLEKIMGILGKPTEAFINRIENRKARDFIKKAPPCEPIPFKEVFPKATPDELFILENLLRYDPLERMTATQLLDQPMFKKWEKMAQPKTMPTPRIKSIIEQDIKILDTFDRSKLINEIYIESKKLQS